ncbi:MAG: hypothetical protein JJ975_09870 [Bacteroidia bacterium]|nr:hypothetical protein [Bacteroidia bacterium]
MPIVKILSRHQLSSISYAVNYVLREGKNVTPEGKVVAPIVHNLRSKPEDTKGIIQEIIDNEAWRKITTNRVYCFHEILSLSKAEHSATPDKLRAIVKKYLELRGDTVSFAVLHFDKASYHAHIISGGTRYRGRSAGLKKVELLELKNQLESFVQRQYPELSRSLVHHGQNKEYKTERDFQLIRHGRSDKEKLRLQVRQWYNRSQSMRHFIDLINQAGFLHYERNHDGVLTGIVHPETGRKYRFKPLGLQPKEILQLETEQEVSREEKIKQQLMNIHQNRIEQDHDHQRD